MTNLTTYVSKRRNFIKNNEIRPTMVKLLFDYFL